MAQETPTIQARLGVKGTEDVRSAFDRLKADAGQTFEEISRGGQRAGDSLGRATEQAATRTRADISAMQTAATAVTTVLTGIGQAAAGALGFVGSIAKTLGLVSVGGLAGVTALGIAAKSITKSVAESIETTSELAEQAGISVAQMTRIEAAARLSGISDPTAKFERAFDQVGRLSMQAATGVESTIDALARVGLKAEDLRNRDGSLRGAADVFGILTERLRAIQNPALQAKATFELLGGAGKELQAYWGQSSADMADTLAGIDRYGTVLTDAQANESNELFASYEDTVRRFQESMKGLGISVSRAFLPFLAGTSDGLSEFLNRNRARLEAWLTSVSTFMGEVREDIITLFTIDPAKIKQGFIEVQDAAGEMQRETFGDLESKFNFGFVAKLVGPISFIRNAILDLVEAFTSSQRGIQNFFNWFSGKVDDVEDKVARGTRVWIDGKEVDTAKREAGGFVEFIDASGKKVTKSFADMKGARDRVFDQGTLSGFMGLVREVTAAVGDLTRYLFGLLAGAASRLPAFKSVWDYLAQVVRDLRSKLGGDGFVVLPWVGKLGDAINVIKGWVEKLADVLTANSTSILSFATGALQPLTDAFSAIIAVINGQPLDPENFWAWLDDFDARSQLTFESVKTRAVQLYAEIKKAFTDIAAVVKALFGGAPVEADNQFSFLLDWQAKAKATFDTISGYVRTFYEDVKSVITLFSGAASTIFSGIDAAAAAAGLGNREASGAYKNDGSAGRQAIIAGLVANATGALGLVDKLTDIATSLFVSVSAIVGTMGVLLGGISSVIGFIASLIGVTSAAGIALVAGIVVAVGAALAAIIIYWDEIVAGAKYVWGAIKDGFAAMWSGIVAGFDATVGLITGIWDKIVGAARAAWEAIAGAFSGAVAFFVDRWTAILKAAQQLWDYLAAAPGKAWSAVTASWRGLADFFMTPIQKVKDMFASLWDGIKSGAAGAWDWLKSTFGFGADVNIKGASLGTGALEGLGDSIDAMRSVQSQTAFAGAPVVTPEGYGAGLTPFGIRIDPRDTNLYATEAGLSELQYALRRGGLGVSTTRGRS